MRERRIEAPPRLGRAPQFALGLEQRCAHVLERLRQAPQLATANGANGKIQVLLGDTVGRAGEFGQRPGNVHAVEAAEREQAQAAVCEDGRKSRGKREDPRHQARGRLRCRIVSRIRNQSLAERLLEIRPGHRLEQLDALRTALAAQLVISGEIVRGDRAVHLQNILLRIPLVVIQPPIV